jgi:non-specific serine/threonine protein kinase
MPKEQHASEGVATCAPGTRTLAMQRAPDELTTREAAAVLGCSQRIVRRAVASGALPAVKRGTTYRIPRPALLRYAESMASPSPPRPLAHVIAFPGAADAAPLPEPLSSFVGRRADLETVTTLLSDSEPRLLTLTGAGGIGKTRLALAVASAVSRERFPDGVAFVPLADVTGPRLVLPAIAQTLGLRERPGQHSAEQLHRFLRDKQLLLVLDNFEHLLAAGGEVATLLIGAPRVTALVTSRAPLRVKGERELPVQPMTVAGSQATPAELVASDAGRLFVERAREHDPAFFLDIESAPLIAEICARLDGLPLAIELAAARIKVLPPSQLHARLARRLPLLTRGARDAPARHGTMRHAIAWSYSLLDASEQRLFRRLAVFEGGVTLAAAGWMANDEPPASAPDDLEMVANLVDHSLVVADIGPDREPRFRQLETIREFGLEQAAVAGEEDEARALHAAYFLQLARRLRPWVSMHARRAPLEELAAEHANLSQALQWLDRHGPATGFTELVAALCEYWATLGLFGDGMAWLERALGKQEAATAHDRARLLIGYAALLTFQGRFAEAETRLAEILSCDEADGDPLDRSRALVFRAGGRFLLGRYDEAEELLREAHALAERCDDPILHAAVAGRALANLSMCARGQADFARDMSFSEEALRLYEGKQLDLAESISLLDLGAAAFAVGDRRLAVERWREGVMLAGEHGDLRQIADALSGIANVATAWAATRAALLLFGATEALRERTGTMMLWPLDIAAAERSLATLQQSLGEQAVAEGLREGRALSLAEAIAIASDLTGPAEEAPTAPPVSGGLTRRERDVLREIAEQKTDQEIADALFLSRRTVNWHVRSILGKLDAPSRGAAVARARTDGLI